MYLLFDIGGTKTRLGFSENGQEIDQHEIFFTPSEFKDGMALFEEFITKYSLRGKIKTTIGGIAGPLDKEKTKLVSSPNLPFWALKTVKEHISRITESPVILENDTALFGLGEAVRGAGKGNKIVAFLNIGTGIGGVRIVDGKIDANSIGFEPGHQIIDMSSRDADGCGGYGHLESYVSGSGFEMRYHQKAYEITDFNILEEASRILAYGINNTLVYWSPDVVVLGGSMMKIIPFDHVTLYLQSTCKIYPEIPPVKLAVLGDLGGMYGALALLSEQHILQPAT